MRGVKARLALRGAAIAIIGNGSPDEAREFQAQYAPDLAVFTDPERKTYAAAGFSASLLSSLKPSVVGRALGAFQQGFRQSKVQGSAFQQGGVLIAGPGDVLHASYVSSGGGDHPSDDWLLEHLPN